MSQTAPALSPSWHRRALRCLTLALALWLSCLGLAWADGDSRLATPQEKAFHARAMGACQQATPKGPQGWEQVDRSQNYDLDRVSTGLGKSPWPVNYRLSWQDSAALRASEEKILQAGMALLTQQKADQKAAQLQKQLGDLSKELGAALKKGDNAQAMRVQEQMAPLTAQLQAQQAQFDRKYQEAMEANQARDARASLSIQINALFEEFSGPLSEEAPLDGRKVWRGQGAHSPNQGWREGVSLVLLGTWSQGKSGGATTFTARTDANLPATTVQTVAVRVTAAPERARQILASLDWAKLEGLLQR